MFKHHRWLALAAGILFLTEATPARAEIVDFDPATDPVPAILPPDDLATIEALMSADFPYAVTRPNSAGSKILIHRKSGYTILDLNTGALTPVKGAINGDIAYHGWVSDNELGLLLVPPGSSSTQAITQGLSTLTINTDSGAATTPTPLVLPQAVAGVIGVSPDFKQLVVVYFDSPVPPVARTVTLGRTTWIKPDGLPDNLPGRVGESPFGPMSLFDAPIRLRLVEFGFRNWRTLVSLPAESGVNPRSVSWSSDGKMVSVTTMTLPGWAGDRVRGGPPQPGPVLDENSINVREALGKVDPVENPLRTNTELYVFGTANGNSLAQIPNTEFGYGVMTGIAFGPPGVGASISIAFSSEIEGRQFHVYSYPMDIYYAVLDSEFNETNIISNADGGILAYLPDGRIIYGSSRHPRSQLKTYVPGNAFVTHFTSSDSMLQAIVFGNHVLASFQNVNSPPLFRVGTFDAGRLELRSLPSQTSRSTFASRLKWREVVWKASDGWTLVGTYVYPDWELFPPTTPRPLIVWQDGGPSNQMLNAMGVTAENPVTILANLGFPVLIANGSGRRSSGQWFYASLADDASFGSRDLRQLSDGVGSLVNRGLVDPSAVGITGCSYGGYLALQSTSLETQVFSAANPQCSLADLENEFNNGDTASVAFYEGRTPSQDPSEYSQDSPSKTVRDAHVATLMFHGSNDWMPYPLVQAIHDEMKTNETPVRLIQFMGEKHGLRNSRSQLRAIQEMVSFFRTRLEVSAPSPNRRAVEEIYIPHASR